MCPFNIILYVVKFSHQLLNYNRNFEPLLEAWINGTMEQAEAALNQYIDWTPAAAQGLQESILGGDVGAICGTDTSVCVDNII